ncbi:MAG: hypothetical protein AB7E73_04635 [Burkholderiales bacterium]
MINDNFVFVYVRACGTGKLPLAECGPVWQLGVIALLLATTVLALLALRMRMFKAPASL